MAFNANGLRHASGGDMGGGHNIWTYVTTVDTLTQVAASGYFDSISSELKVGDWILINGAANTGGVARVNSNTGGVVDITDAVAVNTDSG